MRLGGPFEIRAVEEIPEIHPRIGAPAEGAAGMR